MRSITFFSLIVFVLCLHAIAPAQTGEPCAVEVERLRTGAEKSKDYASVLARADECVRKEPRSVEALIARAKVNASKDDFDLAIADLNKALAIAPRNAEIYYQRGTVYEKKSRKTYSLEAAAKALSLQIRDAAYADYDKALELNPKKGESLLAKTVLRAYHMGSGFLSLMPEFNRAIELLTAGNNKAVLAEAYYQRGRMYGLEMRNDQAIADYTMALSIKPDFPAAYAGRATTHGQKFFNPKRNIDAAIADYTEYLKLAQSAYFYTSRAELYEDKGETAKAVADYRSALAIEPNNYTAKDRLSKLAPQAASRPPAPPPATPTAEQFAAEGRRKASAKDFDGAIKSFSECLRLKPDAAPCFAFRGYAYGMKGDMTSANADHEAAVQLNAKEGAIYYVRGMMFVELGKKPEAAAEFRNVLKLDPNNQQAQSALRNLGIQN